MSEKEMSEKEIAIDRIKQRMDDISREATANGMTPEILASILNENGKKITTLT